MNQKSKKELAILIVVLILLVISLYTQFLPDSPGPVRANPGRQRISTQNVSGEVLAVGLLENEAPEFSDVKRNIFQFGAGSKATRPETSIIPTPPSPPIVAVTQTMPQVRYLGFYYEKESGLKMASLSNSNKIYVGKVGQILGGKYQVLAIAPEHVILRLVQQEGKVLRVPLGKGAPSYLEWNEDAAQ